MNRCDCPPSPEITEISRAKALAVVEDGYESTTVEREEVAVNEVRRNFECRRKLAEANRETLQNSKAKTFFRQNGRLYPKG